MPSPPSSLPELLLELPSLEALRAERATLEKRRAFVPGAGGVEMREACVLVLVHPEARSTFRILAEVVWVQPDGPGKGVGVQLRALDVEAFDAFLDGAAEPSRDGVGPPETTGARDGTPVEADRTDAIDAIDGNEREDEDDSREGALRVKSLYEKVRRYSLRDRDLCARSGALTDRVALERCFGAAVWEGLLHNPQITPPEVARIARNGTIPRPLVGLIVANAAWLAIGEIQRALLSNPRASGPQVERVLQHLSQSDLRRVAQQTAYRAPIRQAAQKLLKG